MSWRNVNWSLVYIECQYSHSTTSKRIVIMCGFCVESTTSATFHSLKWNHPPHYIVTAKTRYICWIYIKWMKNTTKHEQRQRGKRQRETSRENRRHQSNVIRFTTVHTINRNLTRLRLCVNINWIISHIKFK